MKAIQLQIVKAKKNERANAFKEVKCLCKEFGFTAGMLKGALAEGKNAIELASETEVADTLRKVREAAELGELDALIEQQAQFGRRLTLKNK